MRIHPCHDTVHAGPVHQNEVGLVAVTSCFSRTLSSEGQPCLLLACRFYNAMARAQEDDKLSSFVVQTILTVDDFLMFKAMMVKRNMDLTNQVRMQLTPCMLSTNLQSTEIVEITSNWSVRFMCLYPDRIAGYRNTAPHISLQRFSHATPCSSGDCTQFILAIAGALLCAWTHRLEYMKDQARVTPYKFHPCTHNMSQKPQEHCHIRLQVLEAVEAAAARVEGASAPLGSPGSALPGAVRGLVAEDDKATLEAVSTGCVTVHLVLDFG